MHIEISVKKQELQLIQNNNTIATFYISSSKFGCGEQKNSFKTPRGKHYIRAKIGNSLPIYTAFKARRPTGEIFNQKLFNKFPNRDWILSRILWLSGCKKGFNCSGNNDSFKRFIYIHGTAEEEKIGAKASIGCIRMKNKDIIQLFDLVQTGTIVNINL